MKKSIIYSIWFTILCLSLISCASKQKNQTEEIKPMSISKKVWKDSKNSNPISSNVFCADPTAVEYEGRLYVYGTNDHQQYLNAEKNTYEKIKSLVCFSTDDMVNWTYHGEINVGKIAPWIYASWAPTICSRVEKDGQTHFYLYFSNSGCGVGVITATSPTGPWKDPLGHSLVSNATPGLKDCATPFDPGVCIDDEGIGWLSFGAGINSKGTKAMPGSARIVKLGKDMISFDSDFVEIKAPYLFEASELNFINGTYVYTFNNSWDARDNWPIKGKAASTACSMSYMTTKTPLITDSWEYEGHYFKNPGEMGFDYSNNHTHLHKYNDKWYLFYHTLMLQKKASIQGGFRSLGVDEITVDEENVSIKMAQATKNGVSSIKNLNPFEKVNGTTFATSAEVWYEDIEEAAKIAVKSNTSGSWIFVKNADFTTVPAGVLVEAEGQGTIQIFADAINNAPLATVKLSNKKVYEEAVNLKIKGIHNLYFVFSEPKISLKSWRFW